MPAWPPEADIRQRVEHVCFVPTTDIGQQAVAVAPGQFSTYKILGASVGLKAARV